MNTITIKGRLAQEPQLRTSPAGHHVVTLRVADNRSVNGKEATVYHDVELWREAADEAATHHKGDRIDVTGRLDYTPARVAEDGTRYPQRAKVVGITVAYPVRETAEVAVAEASVDEDRPARTPRRRSTKKAAEAAGQGVA